MQFSRGTNANKNKGRSSHSEKFPRNCPLAVCSIRRMKPTSKSCFSTRNGQSGKCFVLIGKCHPKTASPRDVPRPTQAETFVGNIHREEISQARSGERYAERVSGYKFLHIPERFISQT